MIQLPSYIGPMAFGLKMGVILPGMDIVDKVYEAVHRCSEDGLLADGDIICITESVVAKAQNNYITTDDIGREVAEKLNLSPTSRVAVVFPIASRNRFSMILKGIAKAVPQGEVMVQMSFPHDEVGNEVIRPEIVDALGKELITLKDLDGNACTHPITKVNYIQLYQDTIQGTGAKPVIFLCNNPQRVADYQPDGVIAADIHTRAHTKAAVQKVIPNCIALDEICTQGEAYSEWGVLGSNMSSGDKLKLAPRDGQQVVRQLQSRIKEALGLDVQVLIYGDGAYRDPTSGIYELADPKAAFAATDGLNRLREGVKYKLLADQYFHDQGKSAEEIEAIFAERAKGPIPDDAIEREGTSPRSMEDILASLADLVSGSADAGTPVVLIKGFL